MTGMAATNPVERRRWNDDRWTSVWPRREQLTGSVTPILLDRLALAGGERVLDVGSGAGVASLAAAARVGPAGSVRGADISAQLVRFATERAAAAGVGNVDFVLADVQHDRIPGAPFDVAMSQFGVMFFDRPAVAFANLAAQVAPGGLLGFACWQEMERNPWHLGHAIRPFVAPPPPPAEGCRPTGPFTLGDGERTAALVAGAGWRDVVRTTHELTVTVTRDAIVDDDGLEQLGIPDDRRAEAAAAIDAHLAAMDRGDGTYAAPLAVQVFTAVAGGRGGPGSGAVPGPARRAGAPPGPS
jgi:SAM-dependent methyltransferase